MAIITGTTTVNPSWYTFTLTVTESNVNKTNNTSDVTVVVKLYNKNTWYNYGTYYSGRITCAGQTFNFSARALFDSEGITQTLATKTFTVSHDEDGSKTASISAYWDATSNSSSARCGYASASGSLALTTIARKSTISVPNGNIESPINITINKVSSSFVHTLTYSFYGTSGTALTGTIASKTSFSTVTWTIPSTFYAKIPNATSGTLTVTCATYTSSSSSTSTGTTTDTCTVYVVNANPTISASIYDINSTTIALTQNSAVLIKGYSTARCVITATAQTAKSATINTSTYSVVNGTKSTSGLATSDITSVPTANTTVSVKDSRGLLASKTITNVFINYSPVTVTPLSLYRESTTSNTVYLNYSGTFFNSSFGAQTNTLFVKYRWRITGTAWSTPETFTSVSPSPSIVGNVFSGTALLGTSFSFENSYDFEILILDKLTQYRAVHTLPRGLPIIDIGENDIVVNGDVAANGTLTVSEDVIVNGINVIPLSNSNSDGSYTKFPDGTLICHQQVGQYVTSVTALGGMYYLNCTPANFLSIAPPFIEPPKCFGIGNSSEIVSLTMRSISTTSFQVRAYFATNIQNLQTTYSVLAIGRWK